MRNNLIKTFLSTLALTSMMLVTVVTPAMAAPTIVIYQNAADQYVGCYYLNMLATGGTMKRAFVNALTTSENNGYPIYVTDTSGLTVNYESALNKAETYLQALNDPTISSNNSIVPVPTEQLNVDGTITPVVGWEGGYLP
ncbi:exported hypothetical protein [Candidatus Desulfosporosinus infrequens]|uniref:Uncharacterized protein n=1 Tax=Candidatus Desulfosporosinus infrequens TaxID=2043169 RepID=A0A2U3KBZ9_9FIRM|nr:exported hypothetical protein [Candidatus Desulfosporosinus infrequens]